MQQQAKQYAIERHHSTNHRYNGEPYHVHLEMVVEVAEKFINLIPEPDRDDVLSACWCHDVIEDCRETFNDVKKATNERVAEIVYACTNEKGKNRKERANAKYYEGVRNTPYASFVKLCDRAANVRYSREKGSRMLGLYKDEMAGFLEKVGGGYRELKDYIENI